jgi:hypothetical protein
VGPPATQDQHGLQVSIGAEGEGAPGTIAEHWESGNVEVWLPYELHSKSQIQYEKRVEMAH